MQGYPEFLIIYERLNVVMKDAMLNDVIVNRGRGSVELVGFELILPNRAPIVLSRPFDLHESWKEYNIRQVRVTVNGEEFKFVIERADKLKKSRKLHTFFVDCLAYRRLRRELEGDQFPEWTYLPAL